VTRVTPKLRQNSRSSCAQTTVTNSLAMLLSATLHPFKQNGAIASSFLALCQEYCSKFKVTKFQIF